jgi:phenylacetate-coenzyme A ligase PaaK-like adenylate-forming protein
MRAAWGMDPANIYAATEAPMLASSTPGHPDLEIHEDLLVVEVVDERGRPVPPGVPGHKVLLTNLVNMAQPLIRYELTDAVTLADGPNPTGRPYRRIAAVDGRSADILQLPGLRGGQVAVHPAVLGAAFARLPDVRQYQLLYDGRGLRVRAVLAPGAALDAPGHLRALLAESIEASGAAAPPIEVEEVMELAREPGPAAKIKLVKVASAGAPAG